HRIVGEDVPRGSRHGGHDALAGRTGHQVPGDGVRPGGVQGDPVAIRGRGSVVLHLVVRDIPPGAPGCDVDSRDAVEPDDVVLDGPVHAAVHVDAGAVVQGRSRIRERVCRRAQDVPLYEGA